MNTSPRHVLVTGAAGFIGSHVSEALVQRGYRVTGLDNFDTFYDPAIKRANLAALMAGDGFRLIEGDIRSVDTVTSIMEANAFCAVVHLAARAGVRPSLTDPLLYEDVNCRGTTVILEAARRYPEIHFVHGSSSSVYGSNCAVPFREADAADRPSSPYAATKRSNEIMAHSFHHLYGIPVTCLRFFTVYGPRQRPEMAISKFTRLIDGGQEIEIFGDGASRRDYTYIADIVQGVIRAMERPSGFRIFNLGTTATTPLLSLVETIAGALGKPLKLRHAPDQPGDVPITFADITQAQTHLGYAPQTALADGVKRFVEWYREAPARQASLRRAS